MSKSCSLLVCMSKFQEFKRWERERWVLLDAQHQTAQECGIVSVHNTRGQNRRRDFHKSKTLEYRFVCPGRPSKRHCELFTSFIWTWNNLERKITTLQPQQKGTSPSDEVKCCFSGLKSSTLGSRTLERIAGAGWGWGGCESRQEAFEIVLLV